MSSTVRAASLATLMCLASLVATACSSPADPGAQDAGPAASASASPTPTPSLTPVDDPSPAATRPVDPCLLTVRQVSATLAGSWRVTRRTRSLCIYASSRGAIFAINDVREPDVEGGLAHARTSCATRPREVAATRSFACVERPRSGDVVVGNIAARGKLWVLVIPTRGSGDHGPEVRAMSALLGHVRNS